MATDVHRDLTGAIPETASGIDSAARRPSGCAIWARSSATAKSSRTSTWTSSPASSSCCWAPAAAARAPCCGSWPTWTARSPAVSRSPPGARCRFQSPRLMPWKKVWRNVVLGLPGRPDRARAEAALAEVGMSHRSRRLAEGALRRRGATRLTGQGTGPRTGPAAARRTVLRAGRPHPADRAGAGRRPVGAAPVRGAAGHPRRRGVGQARRPGAGDEGRRHRARGADRSAAPAGRHRSPVCRPRAELLGHLGVGVG